MTAPKDEELAFAGVPRLGELLRAGEVTPRELVEVYLARIDCLNPRLNAFASVRAEEALAEADAALAPARRRNWPLAGSPGGDQGRDRHRR